MSEDLRSEVATWLKPEAQRVLRAMSEEWGLPATRIAEDVGLPADQVRDLFRAFKALGWAFHHKFHSEDDSLIRGSGYSLTPEGGRLRALATPARLNTISGEGK